MFARFMGGMMFPSLEGMRSVAHVLHQLGVVSQAVAPEASVDLEPVAALEREGFFATLLGLPGEKSREAR
jgi:hypothetical protein